MNKLTVLFSAMLFISSAFGQSFKPVETDVQHQNGMEKGLHIIIPGATAEYVVDAWNDHTRKWKSKMKDSKTRNEYIQDDAEIEDVSNNVVDVYAVIHDIDGGVDMKLAFNLGGIYVSAEETPDKFTYLYGVVSAFQKDVSIEFKEDMLKMKEKEIKDAEKDVAKIEDDLEKEKEAIEKAEEMVAEGDEEVEGEASREDLANSVAALEAEVKEMEKALDDKKKELKEKEKELNDLDKAVADAEDDVKDGEKKMEKSAGKIENMMKELEKAKAKLQTLKNELQQIKEM